MVNSDRSTKTTYWGRSKYPSALPPWELRIVPGKGFAAFALRRFEQGELICTELPTVWVQGHHPFSPEQVDDIEARVAALSEEDRRALYDMANVFPEAATCAAGIFMTNSFDMTDSAHGEACAMYCAIARLNHSCCPNAQQTHIPETGEEVLYASRVIELGDEINDCYIELRQSTSKRRAALREIYRFDCECPACACSCPEEQAKDDMARERAAQFDDLIVSVAEEAGASAALDLALEAVRLLTSERYWSTWSARYVPDAHYTIYQLAQAANKKELAARNLSEAKRLSVLLTGPRSPLTAQMQNRK